MRTHRFIAVFVLFFLLAGAFPAPVYAFDGRSGEKVVIASDQVVNDDLYVSAKEFILDGQVNGDVVVIGEAITINGSVNGNLIAGGGTVTINGTVNGNLLASGGALVLQGEVNGSARMAGSAMLLEKARVSKDLLAAGASLEVQEGSTIGRDVLFAGGQCLLGGEVGRNLRVASGGLEIAGSVHGNVKAEVGESNQAPAGPPSTLFMPQAGITVPSVRPGLTIAPSARIVGDLEYTQSRALNFPAGAIGGRVTRREPQETRRAPAPETPLQRTTNWALDLLRSLVTLILIGLLLARLAPAPLRALSQRLRARPWASLGWGVVTYAAFFFALWLVFFVIVLGALAFGLLTLKSLSQSVLWIGILLLFALILGLVLATSFGAKIIFGEALGHWLLERFRSPLSGHRYWPLIIGLSVTVLGVGLLSFPLLPGLLGGLVNLVVILFGLGALWQGGLEAFGKKVPAAS